MVFGMIAKQYYHGTGSLGIGITTIFTCGILVCYFENCIGALGIGITMVQVHLVLVLPWYRCRWF